MAAAWARRAEGWTGLAPRPRSCRRFSALGLCVVGVVETLARRRIEQQTMTTSGAVLEVEHVEQAAGALVERLIADSSQAPVVFDEPDHRGLVGERVVDEVALRVGRNRQQRHARTVAAA